MFLSSLSFFLSIVFPFFLLSLVFSCLLSPLFFFLIICVFILCPCRDAEAFSTKTKEKKKKKLIESSREPCEDPDCMCSENCIVWTSNSAQNPINVVSSPLPSFCPNIFVSSFLTKFHSRFLIFPSNVQTMKTFSNVLLFSFENVFPWS